jgi:hypothetical protein
MDHPFICACGPRDFAGRAVGTSRNGSIQQPGRRRAVRRAQARPA